MSLSLINENYDDMITTKRYRMTKYVCIEIEFNFPENNTNTWEGYGINHLFIKAYPIIFNVKKYKSMLINSDILFNNKNNKYDNLKLLLLFNKDWLLFSQRINTNLILNYKNEKRIVNFKDLKNEIINAEIKIANKLKEVSCDSKHNEEYYLNKIGIGIYDNLSLYYKRNIK